MRASRKPLLKRPQAYGRLVDSLTSVQPIWLRDGCARGGLPHGKCGLCRRRRGRRGRRTAAEQARIPPRPKRDHRGRRDECVDLLGQISQFPKGEKPLPTKQQDENGGDREFFERNKSQQTTGGEIRKVDQDTKSKAHKKALWRHAATEKHAGGIAQPRGINNGAAARAVSPCALQAPRAQRARPPSAAYVRFDPETPSSIPQGTVRDRAPPQSGHAAMQ